MRILFWNQYYLPHIGGVEIYSARLAAELIKRGHEVAVFTSLHAPDLPLAESIDGVEVRRFDFFDTLIYQNDPIRKLKAIAKITSDVAAAKQAFKPDIVHVNLADASPLFHLRTVQAHECPTVVTFQAALQHEARDANSLVGKLIANASALVAVSNFAARNAAEFTGAPLERIEVIIPGIPPETFPVVAQNSKERSRTVAFLGRLVPEKGALIAIDAIASLPDVGLNVIGDGPERIRLELRAKELGAAERVFFHGEVSDSERASILSESCALLVPSLHEELFGMVAVEGALCGLPVIASQTGGLQEIVDHGRTGFLVPKGDVGAMAKAISALVEDPSAASEMGRLGRCKALDLYTAERTCALYERVYERCSTQPSRIASQ